MTATPHRATKSASNTALALILTVIAGCAGTPQPTPGAPSAEQPSAAIETTADEQRLIMPDSPYGAAFRDAELALSHFDWMAAVVALTQVPTDDLYPDDHAYRAYLQSRIDYRQGHQAAALSRLQNLDLQIISPAVAYRILNFQRHMLAMQGKHVAGAYSGELALRLAPTVDEPPLRRFIWRELQRSDSAVIEREAQQTFDERWRGWLQLALIPYDDRVALAAWRAAHPMHPAGAPLPGGMDFPHASAAATTTALLLPLGGGLAPAARAIREGYLAARYSAKTQDNALSDVLIVDTDQYTSASDAYSEAVFQGADLVIGPLQKSAVNELAMSGQRAVPLLTLNRAELPPLGDTAMVQLALTPEDEAERIAEIAFGDGARSAIIVRPTGSRGERVESALRKRWASLGGRLASIARYDKPDDYSSDLQRTLNVFDSKQRARAIQQIMGTPIESTARRRRDIDAVFLLSDTAQEARSLKPLLAFHYAGDIPVYALSRIYGGKADPHDRDLNGINLVVMPWFLGQNSAVDSALSASRYSNTTGFEKLYALGADAYLLQTRFPSLQAGPDLLLQGSTGLLTMDARQRIHRELPVAVFDRGVLRPRSLH